MPERSCPACAADMKRARLGPIELDLCFPCCGVWFDHGELPQLVQGGPAAIRKLGERLFTSRHIAVSAKPSKCPVCTVPLRDFDFPSMPGVRFDGCALCLGLWVPLSALGKILSRVEEQIASRPTTTRDIPEPGPLFTAPAIIPRNGGGAPEPAAATVGLAAQGSTAAAPAQVRKPASALIKPEGHKCLSCGEVNSASAAVCWACGGFLRPAGGGHCPGCGDLLHVEAVNNVQFGYCQGCGGSWVENGNLDALRAQPGFQTERVLVALGKRTGTKTALTGVAASCPKCHVSLMPELLGMISTEPIQTCPKCLGSFLEGGRLADILVGRRL